jgi:hypothetical protein
MHLVMILPPLTALSLAGGFIVFPGATLLLAWRRGRLEKMSRYALRSCILLMVSGAGFFFIDALARLFADA